MNNESMKEKIFSLLNAMDSKKTLDHDLYEELQYWLLEKNDNEYQQDRIQLQRSHNILLNYHRHFVGEQLANKFDAEAWSRHSNILLDFLRESRDDRERYSVEAILIKLQSMFFDVVDDYSKATENAPPNPILTEIYSKKNSTKNKQLLQSVSKVDEYERVCLLNELMDAPLEDMIKFMQDNDWTFEEFYHHGFYQHLLYGLEYPAVCSNPPRDIVDRLCEHIRKKLMKKYSLHGMDFILPLADQFYILTPNKYRIYLEKFVDQCHDDVLTLEKFYSFQKITPVLSTNDNNTYGKLFEIYCKKLRAGNQSTKTTQRFENLRPSFNYSCGSEQDWNWSVVRPFQYYDTQQQQQQYPQYRSRSNDNLKKTPIEHQMQQKLQSCQ